MFAQSEPRSGVLSLSGEMTIEHAREMHELLLQALAKHETLEIDLLNVSKFDTAGAQMLLVLQREAAARGKRLQWLGFSMAVAEVLELLDLTSIVGRPGAVVWS